MGSNCCRQKDQSPNKISLLKVFSRWTHRISPKSETVKIADAEDGYCNKKRESFSDPLFDSSANEDRNHVTMLLPDAPRVPPRKKTRLINKRVSFQSDVEIMKTASSKSLDRFATVVIQEEPKARSKSLESFFDSFGTAIPKVEYLKQRRTSSLEHLVVEEGDTPLSLIAKVRRDTLGEPLDLQAYKRLLVIPKPEEPLIEEESESDLSSSEEQISSFKLASKLRRDTLGDALLIASRSHSREKDTESSTEDLEESVKCSRLCSKLRRDTFGDALRQAVHCKACSSLEDITELEVPLPGMPEEDEDIPDTSKEDGSSHSPSEVTAEDENKADTKSTSATEETPSSKEVKPTWSPNHILQCKACMSLNVQSQELNLCSACSSKEDVSERSGEEAVDVNQSSQKTEPIPNTSSKEIITTTFNHQRPVRETSPVRVTYVLLTDAEISKTLEKIRTTGKIEPKEPYNLVYSSSMKGPFASSQEDITKEVTGKSSSTDSLNKANIIPPDKKQNQLINT